MRTIRANRFARIALRIARATKFWNPNAMCSVGDRRHISRCKRRPSVVPQTGFCDAEKKKNHCDHRVSRLTGTGTGSNHRARNYRGPAGNEWRKYRVVPRPLLYVFSEDAMGGWKKEGGWKTSRMTPLPKRGFGPRSYGTFSTPLTCQCSVFPVQKSTTEQTRSSFGGVQKFSGERVLWYVFHPPYVLHPPISRPNFFIGLEVKRAFRLLGATWDRFRWTVDPSPGHIRC